MSRGRDFTAMTAQNQRGFVFSDRPSTPSRQPSRPLGGTNFEVSYLDLNWVCAGSSVLPFQQCPTRSGEKHLMVS